MVLGRFVHIAFAIVQGKALRWLDATLWHNRPLCSCFSDDQHRLKWFLLHLAVARVRQVVVISSNYTSLRKVLPIAIIGSYPRTELVYITNHISSIPDTRLKLIAQWHGLSTYLSDTGRLRARP